MQMAIERVHTHVNVLPALLEPLREHGNDVLVVVQELHEHLGEPLFVGGRLDGREIVEGVEGPDVELMHGQDGRVAAHDEGKGSDLGDAVGQADGELAAQVAGAGLEGRERDVVGYEKRKW